MSTRCCSVEDCNNPIVNKRTGFCISHYNKFMRHGDPLHKTKKYATKEQISEFIEKALQSDTDNCIEWPFGLCSGYPWTGSEYVHRIVASGEKSSVNREAAHLCDNKKCINPRHVIWSSKSDNILDRILNDSIDHRKERRNV